MYQISYLALCMSWLVTPGLVFAESGQPPGVTVSRAYVHFLDRAVLAFQRGGSVREIPSLEGTHVEKGDVLARLDDRVAQKAFEISNAKASSDVAVRTAQLEHELAKQEYQNVLQANRKEARTYPAAEVERRRIAVTRAEFEVERAKHELEVAVLTRDHAEAELSTYRLEAPFAGTIARVHISQGNSAQMGEKVIELVNTRVLRVQGYVAYRHAWRIQAGDPVVVRVADPEIAKLLKGTEFQGSLQFVDTSAETVREVVGVLATIQNPHGELKDGMAVEMEIRPKNRQGDGKLTSIK